MASRSRLPKQVNNPNCVYVYHLHDVAQQTVTQALSVPPHQAGVRGCAVQSGQEQRLITGDHLNVLIWKTAQAMQYTLKKAHPQTRLDEAIQGNNIGLTSASNRRPLAFISKHMTISLCTLAQLLNQSTLLTPNFSSHRD